jgi:hypothetical protein
MNTLGKRALVTKGEHANSYGTIQRMVGTGHSRRFVVEFDNGEVTELSARSFQIEDEYDGSGDDREEKNDDEGQARGGNRQRVQQAARRNLREASDDEEEFDADYIARVQQLMYVFQRLY